MTRIPASEVSALLPSGVDCSVLGPFIEAAGSIIASADSCLTARGITTAVRYEAQKWLAAHLYAFTPAGQKVAGLKDSERFESYSVSYVTGQFEGSHLTATPYGSTANTLLQGCLVDIPKAPLQIAFFG